MTKRILAYITLLLIVPIVGSSQQFNWSTRVGSSVGNKAVTALGTDTAANQTVVGSYVSSTVTISGSAINPVGGGDNVVYMLNNAGGYAWSTDVHFKSSGSDDEVNDVYYDRSGMAYYAVGVLDGQDTVQGSGPIYSDFATTNYFISRITSSGNVDWVFPDSGNYRSQAVSVTGDGSGNLYLLGRYLDSLEVDTPMTGNAVGDLFLLKISTSGVTKNLEWSRRIHGPGAEVATSVLYDNTNNQVVVIGNFEDSLYAGSLSLGPTVKNNYDVFALRYNPAGTVLSLRTIIASSSDAEAMSADMTPTGTYRVSGRFNGVISGTSVTTNGGYDILVGEFSSADVRQWVDGIGGVANDVGNNIRYIPSGVSFVYGTYRSSVFSFGGSSITTSSTSDVCFLAHSTTGSQLGGRGGIMTFGPDIMNATAASADDDRFYIGSEFTGRARFGANTYTSAGGVYDMTVAQITPRTIYCNTDDSVAVSSNFRFTGTTHNLCSLTTGTLTSQADTSLDFKWYKSGTLIAGATRYEYQVSDTGTYYAEITDLTKGCIDFSDTIVVLWDTLPAIEVIADSVCDNANSFLVTTVPAFSAFTDSIVGTGIISSINHRFYPSIAGSGTHTITVYRKDAFGCQGISDTNFIVYARPQISIDPTKIFSYCQGDHRDTLRFATATGNPTYAYSMFPTNGVLQDSIFRCDILPAAMHNIRYTAVDTNGCLSDTLLTLVMEVKAKPSITLNGDRFCKNSGTQSLLGLPSVTGGIFSGVGVTDTILGVYDPSISTFGEDTISYRFTATNGCRDTASNLIILDTVPVINFVFDDTICEDQTIYTMQAAPVPVASPDSSSYFGHPAVSGNNFFPAISGVGSHKVSYYFRDRNRCSDTASTNIVVSPLPNVVLGTLGSYCENDGAQELTQGTPAGGTYFYKSFELENNIFKPDTSYVTYGPDTVYYIYADSMGCVNSAFNLINVKPKPTLFLSQAFFDNICDNQGEVWLNNLGLTVVSPPPATGGFFSLDSATRIEYFDPAAYTDTTPTARPALTYIYRDTAVGCADTLGIFPDVQISPNISIDHIGATCAGLEYNMTGVGALTWDWSTGDSTKTITIIQNEPTTYGVIGTLGICNDTTSTLVEITEGEILTAKDDSVSLMLDTDIQFDPLSRLYTADTLAKIGTFEIYRTPVKAEEFDTTSGIVAGLNSNVYYKPIPKYRRQDSAFYRICNIICRNICDSAELLIHVLGDPYEFIPNTFTPNGDGVNDTWVVPGIEAFPQSELRIYNRWGDIIYEAAPYNNEWSGQTNKGIGIGDRVVDGTYFYVLYTNAGDPLKGTVEIKSR